MSLAIDVAKVRAVLLPNAGWLDIKVGTFEIDAYEFRNDQRVIQSGGNGGVSSAGSDFGIWRRPFSPFRTVLTARQRGVFHYSSGWLTGIPAKNRSSPFDYEANLLLESHACGIEMDGILGRTKRRHCPRRVGVITGGQGGRLGIEILILDCCPPLTDPAPGARLR